MEQGRKPGVDLDAIEEANSSAFSRMYLLNLALNNFEEFQRMVLDGLNKRSTGARSREKFKQRCFLSSLSSNDA